MALLAALGCRPDSDARRASIYDLQDDPSETNVSRIRQMLQDPDRDVRATALNALVGLGVSDAARLALEGLHDGDGFVRATAAKLVGEVGSAENARALAEVVAGDPDPLARRRAAEALVEVRGLEGLPALRQALADPMEPVRKAAIEALRALDAAFARDELLRALREDASWEVRVQAARTLALTPGDDVSAALEQALADPNEFVRSAASHALQTHAERAGRAGGNAS